MRIVLPLACGIMATFLVACGGGSEADGPANATDTLATHRIQAMEDSLHAKPGLDQRQAQALVDVYLLYAKIHPLDSLAPEYLFRAANVKTSLGDAHGAIALYDRIIQGYGSWGKLPDTYFLKAFTIDNVLHARGEAKLAYQEVVDRFPDDRLAEEAKQSIINLQYSDEELVKRFEAMNADSTKATAGK